MKRQPRLDSASLYGLGRVEEISEAPPLGIEHAPKLPPPDDGHEVFVIEGWKLASELAEAYLAGQRAAGVSR